MILLLFHFCSFSHYSSRFYRPGPAYRDHRTERKEECSGYNLLIAGDVLVAEDRALQIHFGAIASLKTAGAKLSLPIFEDLKAFNVQLMVHEKWGVGRVNNISRRFVGRAAQGEFLGWKISEVGLVDRKFK